MINKFFEWIDMFFEWIDMTVNRYAFGEREIINWPAMVVILIGYTVWFVMGF